jgi:hypothetical protein
VNAGLGKLPNIALFAPKMQLLTLYIQIISATPFGGEGMS